MPVDAPDFDESAEGMSAYKMDGDVHAVVTRYRDKGGEHHERIIETACGEALPEDHWKEEQPRAKLEGEMCEDCWPDSVLG